MRRRLAAILAAEIAGYSRLMGEDEATVRGLKRHQAVILLMIDRYGGRIIDTAGDGLQHHRPHRQSQTVNAPPEIYRER